MGTDPVSTDLPLVAPATAEEKVDHINNLRAAIQAATIQRDHHVQKTQEELRNEQLDAEAAKLAAQLQAIQDESADRGVELTGIAAMKAAATVVPESGQPVQEPEEVAVAMNDGAVMTESDMGADSEAAAEPVAAPLEVVGTPLPADNDLPVTSEVTE